MIVLVDTTIWSLALRRRPKDLSEQEQALVVEWTRLVRSGHAVLMGPSRQEILSGLREPTTFDALREILGDFRYLEVLPTDYDEAARLFNRCRSQGIAGTSVDLLICAVALRLEVPVFTTDKDFEHYSRALGVALHSLTPPPEPGRRRPPARRGR